MAVHDPYGKISAPVQTSCARCKTTMWISGSRTRRYGPNGIGPFASWEINGMRDVQFANTLWGLFHDMPDSWRRHLGLRDLPPRGKRLARSTGKGTKNRAIFNLRRNLPTKKLDVETIEAIWKWADDPACVEGCFSASWRGSSMRRPTRSEHRMTWPCCWSKRN